jgi:hypothetical protein
MNQKKKVLYISQNKKWLFPWTALSGFFLYNENPAFTEKQEIIVTHYVDRSQAHESLAMAQAVNRGAPTAATRGFLAQPIHVGLVVDIGGGTASSPSNSGSTPVNIIQPT